MSVRQSAWYNLDPTGRILVKHDICVFFEKSIEKIQVLLKSDSTNG